MDAERSSAGMGDAAMNRHGKSITAIAHSHETGSVIFTYSEAEKRRLYKIADVMGLRIRVEIVNPFIRDQIRQHDFPACAHNRHTVRVRQYVHGQK